MLFELTDRLRRNLRYNTGANGEDVAHRYLRKKKYIIIARNYRPVSGGHGEIDIVARDGGQLVFVEVKTRASDAVSFPERAVDEVKMSRILRAAREYARRANVAWEDVRFDVISVTGIEKPVIRHMVDAFGEPKTVD